MVSLVAAFVASTIVIVATYYVAFVDTEFWQLADGFDVLIPAAVLVSLANVTAVLFPTRLLLRTTRRRLAFWLAVAGAIGGLFVTGTYVAAILGGPWQFDRIAVIGSFGGFIGGLIWWVVEARLGPAEATSVHG